MNDILQQIKDCFDKILYKAESEYDSYVDEYNSIKQPDDISKYTRVIRQMEFVKEDLERCSVEFDYSIITGMKSSYMKNEMDDWLKTGDYLDEELSRRSDAIKDRVSRDIIGQNQLVISNYEKNNEIYLVVEEKRQRLLKHQEDILELCSQYGITSADIVIDNSTFNIDEWSDVYDDSIEYVEKNVGSSNPITRFKEFVPDKNLQAVSVVALFVLFLTPVLNLISVFFIILLIYSEFTAKDKMQKYAILLGLIYNVTPLDMGYTTDIDETLMKDVEEAIDSDPETDELIEWYEKEQEKYDLDNPKDRIQKEFDLLSSNMAAMTEEYESIKEEYLEKVFIKCKEISDRIEELKNEFEEQKKLIKGLGENRSIHLTYNPKYLLGMKDGVIPEYVETGLRNIVFRPSRDLLLMKKFIQAMIINAYCNVKLPSIAVTVCDPNGFGRDLAGLWNEDMEGNFTISTETMDEVIKSFEEQAKTNLRTLRGRSLSVYNNECEISGKTAIEYNLIIVLSQASDEEGKTAEALNDFMRYSADCGIFVWAITEANYENTYVFNRPFEGVTTPVDFDDVDFIIKFADKFGTEIKNSKPPGLPYSSYLSTTFKKEDMWSISASEYIRFEPGYVDGDPSNPHYYTLGHNGDAHGLIVGTTGSGKSVLINELLTTICLRHSPKELRLWLIDFKGSELNIYLKNKTFAYQLPHLDACLCTSDPDYAESLFKALKDECDRRFNLFKQLDVRTIVEYNAALKKLGREDELMPRILFLVDEFQVIFNKASSRTLDEVNKCIIHLAKVARAAGIHIVFCSQSMKGTIASDTLDMFSLRMALRCSPDVSQQVMSTPYAGNIRQRFGVVYVKSVDDKKLELQKRFKTPYQSDADEVRDYIKMIAEEGERLGFKGGDVIQYEEKTVHYIPELIDFYKDVVYPKMESGEIDESGSLFLGRRMTYSSNKAPENCMLTTEINSNIFAAFQELKDLVFFFNTLKANFDCYKGKYSVFYNSQTDDMHYLCKLDEIVPPELQVMSTRKTSMKDMVAMFKQIVDNRIETKDKSFPIIFVCIGWTNAIGFGIEPDSKVVDPLQLLLQTAGEYNIHWIFLGTARNNTPLSILKACEYKICGRVDEQTGNQLAETSAASKPEGDMTDGFAFYNRKGELSKFKLYNCELDRKIKKTEIFI